MNRKTELLITYQGQPQANNAVVVYQSDTVALILVDMKSKRCEVSMTCEQATFWIEATDESTNLIEKHFGDNPTGTRITLPEFSNWQIFGMPFCAKYTVYITLQKPTP